jgi:VWFA-related protein
MSPRPSAGLAALVVLPAAVFAQAPGGAVPPPLPVFASRVEAVHVDAFVTRDGEPLRGLGAADFDLRADGVRQKVELVRPESLPLELLLVFDVSGSLEGAGLEALRAAGRAALAGLKPGDSAGLLTFGEGVRLDLAPTADLERVDAALQGLRAGGTTALNDALLAACLTGGRTGRSAALLFSDGQDTISWTTEEEVRRLAEESGVLLNVIAIDQAMGAAAGKRATAEPRHLAALRRSAEASGGTLWLSPTPEGLEAAYRRVIETMNARYVLRFEPASLRPGRHDLRVEVSRGDVRARKSYFVPR